MTARAGRQGGDAQQDVASAKPRNAAPSKTTVSGMPAWGARYGDPRVGLVVT